jgi:hypothetical protein
METPESYLRKAGTIPRQLYPACMGSRTHARTLSVYALLTNFAVEAYE